MKEEGWRWLDFSGIVLVIAGFFNFFWGVTALTKDEYYADQFLFANLTFWGWVAIIFGVISLFVGLMVFSKEEWARRLGIVWASFGAVIWFLTIWAAPVLSIIIIIANILVIYGLALYGGPETAEI